MNIAPIKIIVVNNEQEVLSHISVGLLNEGCIVYQATTRKECLESIEKYSPHIVILDDEFGDGKGKDICREIKSNPKTESIFVILCAATKRTAGIIFSQLNGMADDYITKEAETWEIRSSIRSFIKIQEATNKITEQQQYYASLFAYHPDAVYSFDLQGNFTSVNNAGTTLTGYSKEELLSMSFMPLIAPDYLSTCMEFFVKVLKGETHYYNAAIIHKDGHRVEINITGIPIIVNGEIIGIHGISKNITTSVRLKKITVSENKVLELALTGSTLEECLTFLIKSIEDISEGIMGSIMLVEEDGKTLRSGPSPSLPKAYTDCIDGKEIGPEAGSCGTSVYLKKSVFVSDIAQDKLWLNYKDVTLTHGLKACFSFPIFSSTGEVLGTFGYYYTHVHLPDKNDTQLIERAVNIADILIERDKSQKQIYRKDEQLQEISTFMPGALY